MSEWWTYRLRDFLLFSPRTYYRLFEIYNAAIWPAQIVALALGLAVILLLRRGAAGGRARAVAAILAGCWLFVAIAFHAKRYATINTTGIHIAVAFALEAALLAGIGAIGGRLEFERPHDLAPRTGFAILLFALAVAPLTGPLLGRTFRAIELFGVAPDPTAVGTLGVLLLARLRRRWLLMVVPVVWCAVAGLTLFAMKAPDFWVAPSAAVVAVVLAARHRRVVVPRFEM
jgi:Family of unknown function (DUF6064)